MSSFRTVLQPHAATFCIRHTDKICCIGSCFTENIGKKLIENKFQTHINPFGIVYNPISIAKQLTMLCTENFVFDEKNLIQQEGAWHSLEHHSSFSRLIKADIKANIDITWQKSKDFLQGANVLVLTLGSAFTYQYIQSGDIVANCHKLPNREFSKKMLGIADVTAALSPILQYLKQKNTGLRVILTISPVRHLSDGMVENQRSKSVLLLSVAELAAQLDFVTYFPAYELVMDDLRDYRFFEADMIHPNNTAIDYIWGFFETIFFEKPTLQLNEKIANIRKARAHRPFQVASEAHQRFVKKQLQTIEQLQKQYKMLDFEEENRFFSDQLERCKIPDLRF
jgi:hypothetical protein